MFKGDYISGIDEEEKYLSFCKKYYNAKLWPGTVEHACNPTIIEVEPEGLRFQTIISVTPTNDICKNVCAKICSQ